MTQVLKRYLQVMTLTCLYLQVQTEVAITFHSHQSVCVEVVQQWLLLRRKSSLLHGNKWHCDNVLLASSFLSEKLDHFYKSYTDTHRHTQTHTLTLVGRGHSSKRRVITAGPSGSSSGITRIRDWTTSSQPSSEGEERKRLIWESSLLWPFTHSTTYIEDAWLHYKWKGLTYMLS